MFTRGMAETGAELFERIADFLRLIQLPAGLLPFFHAAQQCQVACFHGRLRSCHAPLAEKGFERFAQWRAGNR